ncbi:xanthine dehydrogenase accessory factor [Desulfovibrionales bacterium]
MIKFFEEKEKNFCGKIPLSSSLSSGLPYATSEAFVLIELRNKRAVALATVASRIGSAPRLPGTKLALATDGTLHGSIGGGLLESLTIEACRRALATGLAELITYDLTGDDAATDMICGGVVEVLVERIEPAAVSLFEDALATVRPHSSTIDTLAWLIDITNPTTPLRRLTSEFKKLPESVQTKLRHHATGLVEFAGHRYLVDPLTVGSTLLLCGGGHISIAVANLAHQVGFTIEVVDDRSEFVNPQRFPMAIITRILSNFVGACEPSIIGPNHFIAILTRGHHYDLEVLTQALKTPACYIGMIGSRRKRDAIFTILCSRGFTTTDLTRVYSPIGLPIDAETPAELAISIVAELIAVRAGVKTKLTDVVKEQKDVLF